MIFGSGFLKGDWGGGGGGNKRAIVFRDEVYV